MKWLILLFSLSLVGCVHTPTEVPVTEYVLVKVECEDFGRIEPVDILPVVWVEGETEDGFKVLGLRGDMYSNLSIILRDTLRYIGAQEEAIDYYKKCIEVHNSKTLNKEGEPE
jgi:hypothetical protein